MGVYPRPPPARREERSGPVGRPAGLRPARTPGARREAVDAAGVSVKAAPWRVRPRREESTSTPVTGHPLDPRGRARGSATCPAPRTPSTPPPPSLRSPTQPYLLVVEPPLSSAVKGGSHSVPRLYPGTLVLPPRLSSQTYSHSWPSAFSEKGDWCLCVGAPLPRLSY